MVQTPEGGGEHVKERCKQLGGKDARLALGTFALTSAIPHVVTAARTTGGNNCSRLSGIANDKKEISDPLHSASCLIGCLVCAKAISMQPKA